jgi:NAD(P)-dependent dehydrogenase (short-subunit alcohol dehydrogenase family)
MIALLRLEALLFHEVWICLQHGNVLCNPLCQRLDRNYGISLFKNDMVWVIAFTLSAYWLREILSMSLCYNLVSTFTKQLILISSGYHAFKIVNVNIDAWRKWSPKLGILRLLLDYWHFDTVVNCIISFKRMFLQGFDTAVHGCIIYDIVNSDISEENVTVFFPSKSTLVLGAAVIWFIHALVVQISRKSTATMMVELYRKIAIFLGLVEPSKNDSVDSVQLPSIRESKFRHTNDKTKGTNLDFFLGPHIHTVHKSSHDCLVCRMLAKPDQNAKSVKLSGPDVVFLAHPMQLSSAFSLWADKGSNKETYWRANWWMENVVVQSVVFFISIVVYPIGTLCFRCSPVVIVDKSSHLFQKSKSASPLNTEGENDILHPSIITRSEVWFAKSFGWQYITASPFWRGYAKETVVRSALRAQNQGVKVLGLGALNKAHWLNNGGEDLVTDLERRSPEGYILSPLDVELGLLKPESTMNKIKVVHGNTLTAAVVCYQLRVLLSEHFANQSAPHRDSTVPCKALTVIVIGATSKIGRAVALTMAATEHVRVICVGCKSKRLDSIIEEARLSALSTGKGSEIISCTDVLTASESAVDAVWLLGKGDRLSPLVDLIPLGSRVLSYAVPCPLSVLEGQGVCEKKRSGVGRLLLRDDVIYSDAGVMVLPEGMQAQRQFALMLPNHLVYTCHAAALVHHLEGWEHHEVGEVPLENMDVALAAAIGHGFSVSLIPPRDKKGQHVQCGQRDEQRDGRMADVAVIGCGPGGLATAASLLSTGTNANTSAHSAKGSTTLLGGSISNTRGGASSPVVMFDHHTDIEGQVRKHPPRTSISV